MSTPLAAYASLAAASQALRVDIGEPEFLPHYSTEEPSLYFLASLQFDPADVGGDAGGHGARLVEELYAWAERWGQSPCVDLMVILPPDFPARPPEVRVLRPLLECGSGGVVNGFLLGLPALFPAGWVPRAGLPAVLEWVRTCLVSKGARVDSTSSAFYPLQAYAATRARVTTPPPAAFISRSHFSFEYTVFSSSFAEVFLRATIPPGFDAGGKVLLPMAALELLMRSELKDGLDAGSSGLGAPSILGAALNAGSSSLATSAAAAQQHITSMLSVSAEDATTSESAMTFAITSALNVPVFAGVREFTSPEPDLVIVPPEMLTNLGVPEGSRVRIIRVDLPQVTSVVLQPHSTLFHAIEDISGVPPREFLEESFSKYSALQPGQTILCDGGVAAGSSEVIFGGGGEEEPQIDFRVRPPEGAHRFSVVSIKPDGLPGGSLFMGFASSISIEFLPALDDTLGQQQQQGGGHGGGDDQQHHNAALSSPPMLLPGIMGGFGDSGLADEDAALWASQGGMLPASAAGAGAATGGGAHVTGGGRSPRGAPIPLAPVLADPALALKPSASPAGEHLAAALGGGQRLDGGGTEGGGTAASQPTPAERRRLAADAAERRMRALAAAAGGADAKT